MTSGRDPVGKLLSRSKIMKAPESVDGKPQHYHWRDLTIDSKGKTGNTMRAHRLL
jgi:hypothetical protein